MSTTRSGSKYNLITVDPDNSETAIMADIVNQDNPQIPPQEQEPTDNVNQDNTQALPQQQGVTNEQIYDTLQTVLAKVTTNEESMVNLTADILKVQGEIITIKEITNESEAIKEQLFVTQGKVARLESKNQTLEDKLTEYETKLFEKDLMFFNINEEINESSQSLKEEMYIIFTNIMKMRENQIFSRTNPAGEVRIDTVTRIGKILRGRSRPVLVTFISKTARYIVYSRTHTSYLKSPTTTIRVAEHYPSIVKERRQLQIESLKNLRTTHENSDIVVTLKKDQILLDGKLHDTAQFNRNSLSSITPFSIHYEKLHHTDEINEKNSIFQGHSLRIKTRNHAIAARNAILQNPDLAQATHIIYAYKFGDADLAESGFSDDSEVGGGKIMMDLINESNLTNIFICVTRKKNGFNIGQLRFTHIKTCVNNLIHHYDEEQAEPTFHHVTFNLNTY